MGKPFIVHGDTTPKKGSVIASSVVTRTNGRAIARVGDRVTCHWNCTIASGDASMMIDGKAAAREGDVVSCGARLIASQRVSRTLG